MEHCRCRDGKFITTEESQQAYSFKVKVAGQEQVKISTSSTVQSEINFVDIPLLLYLTNLL